MRVSLPTTQARRVLLWFLFSTEAATSCQTPSILRHIALPVNDTLSYGPLEIIRLALLAKIRASWYSLVSADPLWAPV